MICGSSFRLAVKPTSSATGPNRCRLTARGPELFMCVARKAGIGRNRPETNDLHAVAVDWRDCSWSPRIMVQNRRGEAADPAKRDGNARPAKTANLAAFRGCNGTLYVLAAGCRLIPQCGTGKRAATAWRQPSRLLPQSGTASSRVFPRQIQCPTAPAFRPPATKRLPVAAPILPPARRNRINF